MLYHLLFEYKNIGHYTSLNIVTKVSNYNPKMIKRTFNMSKIRERFM